MNSINGAAGEKLAFDELGRAMFRLLHRDDERIEYVATMLSSVSYERMRASNRAGKYESPTGRFNSVDHPYEVSKLLRELRAATYREGAGTWFSIRMSVTAAGAATAEYNYDEEPEWDAPVDPVSYVNDLKKFPRDEDKQPEWLRHKLAQGQAKLEARGK